MSEFLIILQNIPDIRVDVFLIIKALKDQKSESVLCIRSYIF
jgi:hypothetical protein